MTTAIKGHIEKLDGSLLRKKIKERMTEKIKKQQI